MPSIFGCRAAFTLPELIVSIVILSILSYFGTVGYAQLIAEDRVETALDAFLQKVEQFRVDSVITQDRSSRLTVSLALSGYVQEYRERKFDSYVLGEAYLTGCTSPVSESLSCSLLLQAGI